MSDTFTHRAWRYKAAMDACPTARFAELVPIAALKKRAGVLFDLMGGNGYVSDHLRYSFKQTYLIDQCSSNLPVSYAQRTSIHADAANVDFSKLNLPQADTIVCLAGFHHLPEESERPPVDVVNAFRTKVLKSWREGLSIGGRLIVADVVASGAHPQIERLDSEGLNENLSHVPALHGVNMCPPEVNSDPAEFLNDFVHKESSGGHDCQFESIASLTQKLESAGYNSVEAKVYYTPWVFPDRIAAIKFVAGLFGIGEGPAVSLEGQLLPPGDKTEAAIEKYLGMNILTDGRCVVHWKLLYAWGERCDG